MNIILCNYPRCGSNWVGLVLQKIIQKQYNFEWPVFYDLDMLSGLEGQQKELYEQCIKDVSIRILKTHFLPTNLLDHIFLDQNNCFFINIIRNPIDIAVSYFNFLIKHNHVTCRSVDDGLKNGEFSFFIKNFIDNEGIPGYPKWKTHLDVWLEFLLNKNGITLTYSDLCSNASSKFVNICLQAGISKDFNTILECLSSTNKSDVNEIMGGGFSIQNSTGNHSFMLTQSQIIRFKQVFGDFPPVQFTHKL